MSTQKAMLYGYLGEKDLKMKIQFEIWEIICTDKLNSILWNNSWIKSENTYCKWIFKP